MSDDFIALDIQGFPELHKKLEQLPPEVQDAVIDEVAPYLQDIMKAYQPYRYISRKSAYGVMFFTDKQRRGYFAKLESGEISTPYRRTQTLRNNWKIIDKGRNAILANETPYAGHVMGDGMQNRLHQRMGWKTMEARVREHWDGVLKRANAAVKKAIKKVGL